ncbi:hypothetical protein MMF83_00028660 [Klebsiella pneumoniae]
MTSTPEFLNKLDYRQLQFCRDECEARIKAIEEEERAVTDGQINYGCIEQRTTWKLSSVDGALKKRAIAHWLNQGPANSMVAG